LQRVLKHSAWLDARFLHHPLVALGVGLDARQEFLLRHADRFTAGALDEAFLHVRHFQRLANPGLPVKSVKELIAHGKAAARSAGADVVGGPPEEFGKVIRWQDGNELPLNVLVYGVLLIVLFTTFREGMVPVLEKAWRAFRPPARP